MQRKTGRNHYYSTMTTPYSHGDDSTLYHQNPSFYPNTISTFAESPNYHAQETQNHEQISTTNVANHHVIANVASNNPNGHYQETQHHTNVADHHVIDNNNVGRNNNDKVNNNMVVGLPVEDWPYEYPPGYRFCPEDGELISYYLRRRIMELSLPHGKIKDVNLYRTTPDKVTAEHEPVGENDWYFFTPRNRKYRNGKRPNRATGTGYWKATGADKPVEFEGKHVGFRKALVFYIGKAPKGKKTNWIMHEYKVLETAERERIDKYDMKLDDWVLCRIYKKNGNSASRTKGKKYKNKEPTSQIIDEANSPAGSIVEESHPQPEMVVKDKMPFLPLPPDSEFIEYEDDSYKTLFEENLGYVFSDYNLGSIVNNCRPPPNPFELVDMSHHTEPEVGSGSCFYDFQSNTFRHGLINGEVRASAMSNPVHLVNNGFSNSLQDSVLLPLEDAATAGEFAPHCPPSKKRKYV